MKILFVDNEIHAHTNFNLITKNRKDISSLDSFFTPEEALSHAQHNPVDCAFLDIDLDCDMDGLTLAQKLKEIQPHMEIAFLTAFNEHARESYRLGGCSYITKPYSTEDLDHALGVMKRLHDGRKNESPVAVPTGKIVEIKTFGNFDLIVDNVAVLFKNAKAKEALAFLVHQKGGSVSGAQVLFALWENQEYTSSTYTYVRRTFRALEDELNALGIDNIILRSRNCYSLDISRIVCDSYDLLNGSHQAASNYAGEYMRQYSWGESIIPLLDRAAEKIYTQKK